MVGKFVEYYGDGLAGLPLADRATIANMAPEYGATCGLFPIDAETIRYLELSGRPPSMIRLVEAYAKAQGMFHGPGAPRPSIPTRSSWTSRPSSRAWPARGGRRTACRCTMPRRRSQTALKELQAARPAKKQGRPAPRCRSSSGSRPKAAGRRSAVAEPDRTTTAAPAPITQRLGRDRRDHELHQYLEPLGDGRRRAPGQEGRRARARDQALGQGQPGARARRSSPTTSHDAGLDTYLDQLRFNLVGYGCTTCIGNSGPLPPADLRGDQRRRPGRRRRPERQPQLRGPDQPRRPRQLPGLAAAGRRLRPGRHDGHRPAERPAGHRPDGQAGLSSRTSGPASARSRTTIQKSVRSEMFQTKYAEVFEGDERWSIAAGAAGRPLRVGRSFDLRQEPALFRRHDDRAATGRADRGGAGAGGAGRQHHDRPHLAGRLDQAGQPGGPLPDRAGRRASPTSTPTARGGATTR